MTDFFPYLGDSTDIGVTKVKRNIEILKTLDQDRQALLGFGNDQVKHQREILALHEALSEGMKPSDYVEKHLSWLFKKDIISEAMKDVLKDAVDLCLTQPYSLSWRRRSFRSKKPTVYLEKICRVLRFFANDPLLSYSLIDLLTGHAPEDVLEYLSRTQYSSSMTTAMRISSALNRHDEAVEHVIREMIEGDGKPLLMHEVIQGIVGSSRQDMYELLGRLLLAARLQEGLRQAICEKADMGTEEAFRYLIAVIDDHNLIRFSAVKRAVGTWLGLDQRGNGRSGTHQQ